MTEDFDIKYTTIYQKSKANFMDNIIEKEELKIIFYKSFYRFKQEKGKFTFGYPINNETNSECFRISGFNIFMRMHNKIWDEIDKLCDIAKIRDCVTKVQQDKCLTEEETKDYNKYLLLQTSIEISSKEILEKIYPGEILTKQRQKLLNERFKKISLEAIITDGFGKYIDPVLYVKDSKNYNKLFYLENIKEMYDEFAKKYDINFYFKTEVNISTLYEFFEDSSSEVRKSSCEELFKELKTNLTGKLPLIVLQENKLSEILDSIDKTVNDRQIENDKIILEQILQNLRILKQEQDNIIEPLLKDKKVLEKKKELSKIKKENLDVKKKENEINDKRCEFEEILKNYDDDYVFDPILSKSTDIDNYKYDSIKEKKDEFKKIVDLLKSFIDLSDERFDNLEDKFEKFTIENCSFSKLRKMKERELNRILAIDDSPGNVSAVFFIFFTKYVFDESFAKQIIPQDYKNSQLNLSNNVLDLGAVDNDYILLNYSGFQNLYPPKTTFNNIKKMKVKISGADKEYRLVGATYNCSGKHSVSSVCYGNECLSNPVEHELINEGTTLEFKLDSPLKNSTLCNSDDYKIELLVYEPIEVPSVLKTKLDDFKSRFTNIEDIDEKYLNKYIKYKNKYLNLKNIISKKN